MASTYLGPENPAPFSVISEKYTNKLALPTNPEFDQPRFGDVYEGEMFKLIHKYLELGTTDRFCYIGEKKGSFELLIARKFCLIKPLESLYPIKTDPEARPASVSTMGAKDKNFEQYILAKASECQAQHITLYDRVLIMDVLQNIQNQEMAYTAIRSCMDEEGVLVIVHRASVMNTLPLYHTALKQSPDLDPDILKVIKHIKSAGFDVKWEIELLPVVMPKVKWLSMVKDRFPTQLEGHSNVDILSGLRELSEGMFKYEGELVEFTDRLLFITATPKAEGMPVSMVQRYGTKGMKQTLEQSKSLRMEVDKELSRIIKRKEENVAKGRAHSLWAKGSQAIVVRPVGSSSLRPAINKPSFS